MAEDTTTRAGRPKSEQKKKAILDAATELFLAKGFQGASMDAVAHRAGVSKQTVYSHFANKEELFAACVHAKVSHYGFGEAATDTDNDLRTSLLTITHRVIALLTDPEVVAAHRVVICEATTQPHIAALFYESGPQRTITSLCDFLTREVDRGRLQIEQEDLLYASKQLLLGAIGIYQLEFWMGLRDSIPVKDLEHHLNRVVDDFLHLYGTGS